MGSDKNLRLYIGLDPSINELGLGVLFLTGDAKPLVFSYRNRVKGSKFRKRPIINRAYVLVNEAIAEMLRQPEIPRDLSNVDIYITVEVPSRRWQHGRAVSTKDVIRVAVGAGAEAISLMSILSLVRKADFDVMMDNLVEVWAYSNRDFGLPTKGRALATLKYYGIAPVNKEWEDVTNNEADALVLAFARYMGWVGGEVRV